MCGINFIIDNTASIDSSIIKQMASATKHRGPDETIAKSYKTAGRTYHVAANRLKITDQTAVASQPFLSADGRYILVFNGEIYNFAELKNQLLAIDVRFSSQSDTEVLFHWLINHGEDGIAALNGMFAFIFLDLQSQQLLVARDRFGIKPIYFANNDRFLLVSSEIQPIVHSSLITKELNTDQVQHYLMFKYVKPPHTFFRWVKELLPGQQLAWKKGEMQIKHWYAAPHTHKQLSPEAETVEHLIRNSLLNQLQAPVPLGLLLSGGVDSTLLLAIARDEGYTMPTFSIVNHSMDRSFGTNDYKYARLAARHYGSEHHETVLDRSILDQFDGMIAQMDQPIGDSSFLMTSEICKLAAANCGIKVLLSGAGADELFGGYNRHWAFYQYLKYRSWLVRLAPLGRSISALFPSRFTSPWRKSLRLLTKMAQNIDASPEQTYVRFLAFDELAADFKWNGECSFETQSQWMGWAMSHDLQNYLVADVLALSDKASMRHGVELRLPYLDNEIVQYIKNCEPSAVLNRGRKWLLRDLLIQREGKVFANRRKEGFGLPLGSWLTEARVKHLWEFLDRDDHLVFQFLDKGWLNQLLSDQQKGSADHGPFLWSVLVLAHWLNRNF
jgi:asparagine synthase (glutamine-hydrolysing)